VNLTVGDTQQFTAVDELGRPRKDATWTVSDTMVATITTDGQPVLTALAVGQVTLTARVQGVSTQVQLNIFGGSLVPGTVRWSFPSLPGYEPFGMVPAVPSEGGPEFYSFYFLDPGNTNKNIVLGAFSADGQLLWQQPAANQQLLAVPDAFGGAIMNDGNRLIALDGQTGAPVWQSSSQNGFNDLAIRPDGSVVAIELETGGQTPLGNTYTARKFLDVFDGNTGQLTLQLPLPQYVESHHELRTVVSNFELVAACQPWNFDVLEAGPTSPATVGANGNIYLEYSVPNFTHTVTSDCKENAVSTEIDDTSTLLLTVSPDGSSSTQTLGSGTKTTINQGQLSGVSSVLLGPDTVATLLGPLNANGTVTGFKGGSVTRTGQVIPDGKGGALATWEEGPALDPPQPVMVTHISPTGGGTYSLPIEETSQLVLGENGAAFAVGLSLGTADHNAISFDMNSGQVVWSYQSSAPNVISMIAATPGGGLVAQEGDNDGQAVLHFDSKGQASHDSIIGSGSGFGIDWQGRLYDRLLGSISAPPIPVTWANDWAEPNGNSSGTKGGVFHHSFGLFWCGSGHALQGYAAVNPSPCTQGNGNDIQWGYYPEASGSCAPATCGITALKNFSADHPDWVSIVESEAIKSFKAAFAKYPIQVQLATQGPYCPLVIRCSAISTPDQEYTVYILGDYPFPAAGKLFSDSASTVYYFALMEGAQEALGRLGGNAEPNWVDFSPIYPPQDTAAFVDLLRAMGRGIGNAAAHEIGHHLELIKTIKSNGFQGLPFMDCGLNPGNKRQGSGPLNCENGNNFVYGFYNSDGFPQYGTPTDSGGMFFYGVPGGTPGVPVQPTIHWGPSDILWLQNYAPAASAKQQ